MYSHCSLFECNIDKLYAKYLFLLNCTAMFIIARFEVLLITQKKAFVKHSTLIEYTKLNVKLCLTITIVESKKK